MKYQRQDGRWGTITHAVTQDKAQTSPTSPASLGVSRAATPLLIFSCLQPVLPLKWPVPQALMATKSSELLPLSLACSLCSWESRASHHPFCKGRTIPRQGHIPVLPATTCQTLLGQQGGERDPQSCKWQLGGALQGQEEKLRLETEG